MTSGVFCAVYIGDLMNRGIGILTWYTILALACSSVVHWMLELFVKEDSHEGVQVDKKTLVCEGRNEEKSRPKRSLEKE